MQFVAEATVKSLVYFSREEAAFFQHSSSSSFSSIPTLKMDASVDHVVSDGILKPVCLGEDSGEFKLYMNKHFLSLFQESPHRPFKDSKTIVDSTLLLDPRVLLKELAVIPDGETFAAKQYERLLGKYFKVPSESPESLVLPAELNSSLPDFAKKFPGQLRLFVVFLKKTYQAFYREAKCPEDEEIEHASFQGTDLRVVPRTSLLALPNGYFVPGGRFRECYYWDTYWSIKGLLACNMIDSATKAVENLLYLVSTLGFVPNGNRVYYLERSQPPMLTEMVEAIRCYWEQKEGHFAGKKQLTWINEGLSLLEKEYAWWMKHRSVEIKVDGTLLGRLNRFTGGDMVAPRPESFKEDSVVAGNKESLGNILAGCESGWDFSSRWFSETATGERTHEETVCGAEDCTRDLAPICLNSIMLRIEYHLSKYCKMLNKHKDSQKYAKAAKDRRNLIMRVMWDEEEKMWHDYNWKKEQWTSVVSAASWFPLWAGCYGKEEAPWGVEEVKACVDSLIKDSGLLCVGGVATTLTKEGPQEQWDWPNGWPPVQEILIAGLRQVEKRFGSSSGGNEAAFDIAQRWLGGLFRCWKREKVMHEKYDVTKYEGGRGAGGEYEPQVGFGWTNGVVLELLNLYQTNIEKDATWLVKEEEAVVM